MAAQIALKMAVNLQQNEEPSTMVDEYVYTHMHMCMQCIHMLLFHKIDSMQCIHMSLFP